MKTPQAFAAAVMDSSMQRSFGVHESIAITCRTRFGRRPCGFRDRVHAQSAADPPGARDYVLLVLRWNHWRIERGGVRG
jgi:hypothetical protein